MNRWDIINEFLKRSKSKITKNYLEIGYYKGWSFDNVTGAQLKVAVDPNPCKTPEQQAMAEGYFPADNNPDCISVIYKMTSDNFFGMIHETIAFDVIFIDGLHEANQVMADIHNALDHLKPGGIIVLHDCNPPEYLHTTTGINGCWTGDTYKAWVKYRAESPYFTYTIDTDWGVGVIDTKKSAIIDGDLDYMKHLDEIYNLQWNGFDSKRVELLNLISVDEFKTKLNERTENNNSPA